MHELQGSLATTPRHSASPDDVDAPHAVRGTEAPLEFVGASDDTIAEAVRRALSTASVSLRTLDGAGVLVIPQIDRLGTGPRYQVTLRISPATPAALASAS